MACLAVVGASGRTGIEVLRAAAAAGHQVIAICRDPAKLSDLALDIEVRKADVLDAASMANVLDSADAVISALGPDDGRRPSEVCSQGMRTILRQMRLAGVRRVVAVSAVPVSAPSEKTVFERLVLHPILWRFFRESYRDLRLMESEMAAAEDIEWAVVRPPLLTDDTADHAVRMSWSEPLRGARKISRRLLGQTLVETAAAEPFTSGILTVTQA